MPRLMFSSLDDRGEHSKEKMTPAITPPRVFLYLSEHFPAFLALGQPLLFVISLTLELKDSSRMVAPLGRGSCLAVYVTYHTVSSKTVASVKHPWTQEQATVCLFSALFPRSGPCRY